MRPNRLAVPQSNNQSFDLRHEVVPYFANPWHFHPEIELNYVISGNGTRFIGQNTDRFSSGEIILLGKNLPHYWKSDLTTTLQNGIQSEAIVARFTEDFTGKGFFLLPETRDISHLFEKACYGLILTEPLKSQVAQDLRGLIQQKGFDQLFYLIQILYKIATSDSYQTISPNYTPSHLLSKSNERLNKVIAHLLQHFTKPISLEEIAEIAHMNQAAFCRYFKGQTGQTLTQYVTGLRIGYACDLLLNSSDSVTQICYQVGFENVSHFIQIFKKLKNQTPFEFRKSTFSNI